MVSRLSLLLLLSRCLASPLLTRPPPWVLFFTLFLDVLGVSNIYDRGYDRKDDQGHNVIIGQAHVVWGTRSTTVDAIGGVTAVQWDTTSR